jgi:hypothetical protein
VERKNNQKPRSFKNGKKVPAEYAANKRVWTTSDFVNSMRGNGIS